MSVHISEEFADSEGRLLNYDSYDVTQRNAVVKQRHVDIRSFIQNDITNPATLFDLATYSMTQLEAMTMDQIEALATVAVAGEHWTAGTVAPQSDRKNWNGLSLTCSTGLNTTQSVVGIVDLATDFVDGDHISVALPAFPLANINTSQSFVVFTSHPTGNFTTGPTDRLKFSDSLTALSSGDSELRFLRSALANVNRAAITGVRFEVQATGACTFRALAVRLLSQAWLYAPLDINTRYGRLVKPVPRNGAASPTIAFPTATAPVTPTDWPILFRSTTPASDNDPRPIDASLGVFFYTGARTTASNFSLYFRELPLDDMTQLDLDSNGSTNVTQATLNALGRQPDYDRAKFGARRQSDLDGLTMGDLDGETQGSLERIDDFLSAAWIKTTVAWSSTGATLGITDANLNGYSGLVLPTLAAQSYYFALAELVGNTIRVRLFASDGRETIGNALFDTTITDDGLLRRRTGRIGWYSQLGDGDAFISSVRTQALCFGEYRSPGLESLTPVVGAQLAVESSPPRELASIVTAGPWGGTVVPNSDKAPSGLGWKVTNPGQPLLGVQTNPFEVDDWAELAVDFDLFFSSSPTSVLQAFLLGRNRQFAPLPLPPIVTNRWQHISLEPTDQIMPTGQYTLVLAQLGSDPSTWYLDNLSVKQRTVSWSARGEHGDAWGDNGSAWTNFKDALNDPSQGALFPVPGTSLQVRGRALAQDAVISKATAKPLYAQLGRVTFDATPVIAAPTAAFATTQLAGHNVLFDGTTSSANVISWEWDFGDGKVGSGAKPLHLYAAAGTYSVTLVVRDQYGNPVPVTSSVVVS